MGNKKIIPGSHFSYFYRNSEKTINELMNLMCPPSNSDIKMPNTRYRHLRLLLLDKRALSQTSHLF